MTRAWIVGWMLGAPLVGCSSESGDGGQSGSGAGGAASGGADNTPTAGMSGAVGGAGSSSTGGTASGGQDQGGDGTSGGGGNGGAGSGGVTSGGAGGGGSHTGPWKVMMLGDSITGSTCYPQLVHQGLTAKGHTNFQFVGTQPNGQSCGAMQVATQGHGGYGVTYLPQNNARGACSKPSGCGSYAQLQTWAAQRPEIVLMHYGTNDVWDGQPTGTILAAYLSVITEFRSQNPNVIFFVSKIVKLNPWSGTPSSTSCAPCPGRVTELANALTDAWATTNSMPTSPVFIIDNYNSGFDPNNPSDAGDGVHPARAGAQKSADATVAAVIAKNYF